MQVGHGPRLGMVLYKLCAQRGHSAQNAPYVYLPDLGMSIAKETKTRPKRQGTQTKSWRESQPVEHTVKESINSQIIATNWCATTSKRNTHNNTALEIPKILQQLQKKAAGPEEMAPQIIGWLPLELQSTCTKCHWGSLLVLHPSTVCTTSSTWCI